MKHLFIPYELAVIAKQKGFNEECLAYYSKLDYPIDDSGDKFNECKILFIKCENSFDEIKVIDIENEDAMFHWTEGTYIRGDHSRCALVGEDISAPLYQQIVDWFREKHQMFVFVVFDQGIFNYGVIRHKSRLVYSGNPTYKGGNIYTYYEALNEAIEESFKIL